MAVVIAYRKNDNKILTLRESRYVFEKEGSQVRGITGQNGKELEGTWYDVQERYSGPMNAAASNFSEIAKKLSATSGIRIQYDTIKSVGQGTDNRMVTKYRYPSDFLGIVKGKKENNETPIQTALREFNEEIGFRPFETDLRELLTIPDPRDRTGTKMVTIFTFEMGDKALKALEITTQSRIQRHSGEVFDLTFKTKNEIMNDRAFNLLSRQALSHFNIGGKRRTTRTRRNRRRRQTKPRF